MKALLIITYIISASGNEDFLTRKGNGQTVTPLASLEECMEVKEQLDDIWGEQPPFRGFKYKISCVVYGG